MAAGEAPSARQQRRRERESQQVQRQCITLLCDSFIIHPSVSTSHPSFLLSSARLGACFISPPFFLSFFASLLSVKLLHGLDTEAY